MRFYLIMQKSMKKERGNGQCAIYQVITQVISALS